MNILEFVDLAIGEEERVRLVRRIFPIAEWELESVEAFYNQTYHSRRYIYIRNKRGQYPLLRFVPSVDTEERERINTILNEKLNALKLLLI